MSQKRAKVQLSLISIGNWKALATPKIKEKGPTSWIFCPRLAWTLSIASSWSRGWGNSRLWVSISKDNQARLPLKSRNLHLSKTDEGTKNKFNIQLNKILIFFITATKKSLHLLNKNRLVLVLLPHCLSNQAGHVQELKITKLRISLRLSTSLALIVISSQKSHRNCPKRKSQCMLQCLHHLNTKTILKTTKTLKKTLTNTTPVTWWTNPKNGNVSFGLIWTVLKLRFAKCASNLEQVVAALHRVGVNEARANLSAETGNFYFLKIN